MRGCICGKNLKLYWKDYTTISIILLAFKSVFQRCSDYLKLWNSFNALRKSSGGNVKMYCENYRYFCKVKFLYSFFKYLAIYDLFEIKTFFHHLYFHQYARFSIALANIKLSFEIFWNCYAYLWRQADKYLQTTPRWYRVYSAGAARCHKHRAAGRASRSTT